MNKNIRTKISLLLCILAIIPIATTSAWQPLSITVYGWVKDSVTATPVPQAQVRITVAGEIKTVYTNDDGYYSCRLNPIEAGYASVRVVKWGYNTQTKNKYCSTSGYYRQHFSYTERGKRIAFFFYDGGDDGSVKTSKVDGWMSKLLSRGKYDHVEKFMAPSSYSQWSSQMDYLDSLESLYDRVFIFLGGHGWYSSGYQESYVILSSQTHIFSSYLTSKIFDLESERITVVVSACFSGTFETYLASVTGVSVITSCKKHETSDSTFRNNLFYYLDYDMYEMTVREAFEKIYEQCADENYPPTYHPQYDFGAKSFEYWY